MTPPDRSARAGGVSRRAVLAVALALATGLVYAQVRDHTFVNYDDDLYVVENPELRGGLSVDALAWALTTDADGLRVPVTWISYLIDAELTGLSPRGVLVTNALLHTTSGILLFLALSSATGAALRSAFVAAVFLLHPLHAESVAWASERKDVLCALFWNASLLAWVAYARRPTALRYALVAGLFALALGSKPMAVTLPAVLLLLDFWPLRRLSKGSVLLDGPRVRRALLEKLPLLAASGLWMLVTYRVQEQDGVMRSLEVIPLATRIGNASLSYLAYLSKALWPADLSVFYPYRPEPGAAGMVAAALIVGATIVAVSAARRLPAVTVGWLWYLGTLVPVIGLVQVGEQSMANRYAYLPLVGYAIALAWGLDAAARRLGLRQALAALALASVAAMVWVARAEVASWKSGVTLFERAVRADPSNRTARANLGIARLRAGDEEAGVRELALAFGVRARGTAADAAVRQLLVTQAEEALRERRAWVAISLLRAARAIPPEAPGVRERLGHALFLQARFPEAFAELEAAQVGPDRLAELHASAALRLEAKGHAEAARRQREAAVEAALRAAATARSRGRQSEANEWQSRAREWRAAAAQASGE